MDVQTVISREKDAVQFGVITVGSIQSGSAGNIIPDSAIVRGTVRSFDAGVREVLLNGIRRTANAVAAMAGAPTPEPSIRTGVTAMTLAVLNVMTP